MTDSLGATTGDLTARQRNGRRALVLSTDPIGPEMPGPAIRAWELAQVLGQHMEVVLASTVAVSGAHPNAELAWPPVPSWPNWSTPPTSRSPPAPSSIWPGELRETDKPVAVDIYDPYHLENLEMGDGDIEAQDDRAVTRLAGVAQRRPCAGAIFLPVPASARGISGSGRWPPWGGSTPTTMPATPCSKSWSRLCPSGCRSEPPRPPRPRPAGHAARDRAGRQGRALGRGGVQLARPGFPAAGGRPLAPPGARACAWCSWACATPTRPSPRCRWPPSSRRCQRSLG